MTEMIEKVARAILKEVWGVEESDLPSGTMEEVLAGDNGASLDLYEVARAALEATREPTEEMVEAWGDAEEATDHPTECHLNRRRWAAAIDAALGSVEPSKNP